MGVGTRQVGMVPNAPRSKIQAIDNDKQDAYELRTNNQCVEVKCASNYTPGGIRTSG